MRRSPGGRVAQGPRSSQQSSPTTGRKKNRPRSSGADFCEPTSCGNRGESRFGSSTVTPGSVTAPDSLIDSTSRPSRREERGITDQPGRLRLDRAWSLAVAAFYTPVGFGDVLTLDDDDPNAAFFDISSAVDAAVEGAVIEVGPGYEFRTDSDLNPVVRIAGKSFEIKATALDPEDTALAGQGTRRFPVRTDADDAYRINGFTLDSR